jgi:hypothetical protein
MKSKMGEVDKRRLGLIEFIWKKNGKVDLSENKLG